MEFRKFKQKNYIDGTTLRILYIHFNGSESGNVISLQLPVPESDGTWTLIPTISYHHDLSLLPGPSFTMKIKWLKWDILTLKWQRSYKDNDMPGDEEETAEPQTYLDQETWPSSKNQETIYQ